MGENKEKTDLNTQEAADQSSEFSLDLDVSQEGIEVALPPDADKDSGPEEEQDSSKQSLDTHLDDLLEKLEKDSDLEDILESDVDLKTVTNHKIPVLIKAKKVIKEKEKEEEEKRRLEKEKEELAKKKIIEAAKILSSREQEKIKIANQDEHLKTVFKTITPQFLRNTYLIINLGYILYAFQDMYNVYERYVGQGADEPLFYFFINALLLIFFIMKIFDYGVMKCNKQWHFYLLMLGSIFFVEYELETYVEESQQYITFDQWYEHYHAGKFYFKLTQYEKAQVSLNKAYNLLADPDEYFLPFFETNLLLAQTEHFIGKHKASQKRLSFLYKKINKNFASLNYLKISHGLAKELLMLNKITGVERFSKECLKNAKALRYKKKELYDCEYLQLISQLEQDRWEGIEKPFKKLAFFYQKLIEKKKVDRSEDIKFLLHLLSYEENLLNNVSFDSEYFMKNYLELLGNIRDATREREKVYLKVVYQNISRLYNEKFENLKKSLKKITDENKMQLLNLELKSMIYESEVKKLEEKKESKDNFPAK